LLVREQAGQAEKLFKVVSAINRSWRTRLVKWRQEGLLDLEAEPVNFGEIIGSQEFEKLLNSFNARRPTFQVNNFADSFAVCCLARLVQAYKAGQIARVPRFFVSTAAIASAVQETGMEHLLSYDVSGRTVSVLRDSDYYVFRATFRNSHSTAMPESARNGFVESLVEARDRVREIVQAQIPLTPDIVESIQITGKPLPEIIKELRQFWFLERVWLPYAASSDLQKAVSEYIATARHLATNTDFRHRIDQEVRSTKQQIEQSVQRYRRVSRLWGSLDSAVQHARISFRDLAPHKLDVYRTFGLLRFGIPLELTSELDGLIQALLIGEKQTERNARITLVRLWQEVKNFNTSTIRHSSLIKVAAVLWVLHLDSELLYAVRPHNSKDHYSLRILSCAASLRSSDFSSANETMSRLEEEFRVRSSDQNRLDLAIGLAYLYFHLWRTLGGEPRWRAASNVVQAADADSERIVSRAVEFARIARQIPSKDEKKKVYALNQYLYYLVEGSDDTCWGEMTEAAKELLKHRDKEEVWQYRYDDTLARYFHRQALRHGNTSAALEWMDFAKRHIDHAYEHSSGDEEVQTYSSVIQISFADLRSSVHQSDRK
jgi:hypothetical protein